MKLLFLQLALYSSVFISCSEKNEGDSEVKATAGTKTEGYTEVLLDTSGPVCLEIFEEKPSDGLKSKTLEVKAENCPEEAADQTKSRPSVRVDQFLIVSNLSGTVRVKIESDWEDAVEDHKLRDVGHALQTGPGSLARLWVDTNLGYIAVSENTTITIYERYNTERGGVVFMLDIKGVVRINVNPFNSTDDSIETPAGVNGVRG